MSLAQKDWKKQTGCRGSEIGVRESCVCEVGFCQTRFEKHQVQFRPACRGKAGRDKAGRDQNAVAKPVETKPVGFKSAEAKPVAAKPVAAKPAAAKPDAAKPDAATPAATKPVVTKPQVAVALKALSAVRKTAAAKSVDAAAKPAEAPAEAAAPKVAVAEKRTLVSRPEVAAAAPPATAPASAAPDLRAAAVRKPEKVIKPTQPGKRNGFAALEYIVYPAHGVGQIIAVEEQEVAGFKLELFVISFSKDKMILKVPVPKVVSVGMRKLADEPVVKRALDTLTGRARVKRTMWSRRAQEYEAKINSGDLIAIAEVVRDLYRSEAQPEQSYSERQLYEAALDRIVREIGTVMQLTEMEALKLIESNLQKSPRRSRAEDSEADDAEGGVEEEAA